MFSDLLGQGASSQPNRFHVKRQALPTSANRTGWRGGSQFGWL